MSVTAESAAEREADELRWQLYAAWDRIDELSAQLRDVIEQHLRPHLQMQCSCVLCEVRRVYEATREGGES